MVILSDVVELLHGWYPPATADSWDAVGLVAGDPDQEVTKVLFAVDPVLPVAQEAAEWGAQLLVVHHPLFLKGVHGVARTTPKGRTLGVLQDAGCALLTAHTNADQAVGGVSEAMARALGLDGLRPITAHSTQRLDKLTTYVPVADADAVRAALSRAGAGVIGDYDSASFSTPGEGRFRPLEGANPTIGAVGSLEVVDEVRIECVLVRAARTRVVRALLAAHPYEEPAYDVVELADPGVAETGSGRIGTLPETTLAAFAQRVADALPPTAGGVRVAG
ncbi:MAG TPA: Nif3-like dinuclear metal center hexameric protein, partial [Nocardioides sp.]|nr:Nif3-like dinuclear metal center hexameric protein [Nocardioides sp.]